MRATTERERHEWMILPIILVIGFLCVTLAGQWALRFSPRWKLTADMASHLDPNSDFLTRKPNAFIEPVDPSILTQPAWIHLFLTPGASFETGTPFPTVTATPPSASPTAISSPTNTTIATISPTSTFIFLFSTATSTSAPTVISTNVPGATVTLISMATSTVPAYTPTPTAAFTPTETLTPTVTFTATSTPTATVTSTPSNTPDPGEPDFGGPDGNTILLGNGSSALFGLIGFLLDGNSTFDVVLYEKEEASAAGKIHLGAIRIEVYDETTSTWYTIYHWGDGVADTNASYNNNNSEPDGFPVDTTVLYGVPPLNTGIAIDIDTAVIGQGGSLGDSITLIRLTSLSNLDCDVDALQMLR